MDRITRKELKADKFAAEVGHTVEYVSEHRRQVIVYGGIGLAVILAAAGFYFYRQHQQSVEQQKLVAALRVYEAAVGLVPNVAADQMTFPTQDEKDKAVQKAFQDLIALHGGSDAALVSRYYVGVVASDKGKLAEAEKAFQQVAESGHKEYASLAKLSLSQVYQAQGRLADAEKQLRSLVEKPTIMVSKEQAIIALGRLLASTNPKEARKVLEPLRAERSAVSRAALMVLGEIPNK